MSLNMLRYIDAIAKGVRARYQDNDSDLSRLYEEAIIMEVAVIARKLQIPRESIEEWVGNHSTSDRMILKTAKEIAKRTVDD